MRTYSPSWCKHLLGCQRKGTEAFLRGEPKDSCPYHANQSYGTGGKNLTKQRREYWLNGWEVACRQYPRGEQVLIVSLVNTSDENAIQSVMDKIGCLKCVSEVKRSVRATNKMFLAGSERFRLFEE